MFYVVISEKGGAQKRIEFDQKEITIGRVQGNDIILPKGNVSKRHARIVLKDQKFIIVDLKSTNGTYVNGRKISSPQVIKPTDKIYIGDFILHVEEGEPAMVSAQTPPPMPAQRPQQPPPSREMARPTPPREEPAPPPPDPEPPARPPRPAPRREAPPPRREARPATPPPERKPPPERPAPPPPEREAPRPTAQLQSPRREGSGGAAPPRRPPPREEAPDRPRPSAAPTAAVDEAPASSAYVEAQREVHARMEEYLDLRGLEPASRPSEELWEKTENAIIEIVEQLEADGGLDAAVDRDSLVRDVLYEALGTGPLEGLLNDDAITEVMVNRPELIYIRRNGSLERYAKSFSSDRAALQGIARLLATVGHSVDEAHPVCDVRLKDGSLLNVAVPPVAVFGPTITLRKMVHNPLVLDQLVEQGALSAEMAELLDTAVANGRNILVSGPPGGGKTTLLGALVANIPAGERVITVEEVAELRPPQENVVQLESRPGLNNQAEVNVRDVLRNAVRMAPDRLVVGELSGSEALDVLLAMQTGQEGTLTSVSAGSTREALHRLEALALTSGVDLPSRALRAVISEAIQLIVQLARYADGSVKVTQISEVTGLEGDAVALQDVFYFQQEGFDSESRVRGRFAATGYAPRFYEELRNRGVDVNLGIFQ